MSNTGNTRVSSITLTSASTAAWTGFTCTGGHPIASIAPGITVHCSATFAFDQATYEGAATGSTASGSLATSITATATGANAPSPVIASVPIATSYSAAAVVHIDSCTMPSTGERTVVLLLRQPYHCRSIGILRSAGMVAPVSCIPYDFNLVAVWYSITCCGSTAACATVCISAYAC